MLALVALACRPPVPEVTDTAGDTGVPDTAGADTGTDTAPDTGNDTGNDTGTDTGTDTGVPALTETWFTFSELAFVSSAAEIADVFTTGGRSFVSIDQNFAIVNPLLDELYRLSDTFLVEQVTGATPAALAESGNTSVPAALGFAPAIGLPAEVGTGEGAGRGSDCALVARAEDFGVEGVLTNAVSVPFSHGIFSVERPGSPGASISLTNLLSLPQASNDALILGQMQEVGGAYRQRGALRIDLDAERWRTLLRDLSADGTLARRFQDMAAVGLASAVAATPDVDSDGDFVNDAFSALIVFEMEPCTVTHR